MFGMEGREIGVLFVLTVAVLSVGVLGQQAVSEESEPGKEFRYLLIGPAELSKSGRAA